MDINGREYAFIAWMLFLIIIFSFKKNIRDSFIRLIKSFKNKQILSVFGFAIIWVMVCLVIFYSIGLWSSDNLKTTLGWMITYAFVTIFEVSKIQSTAYYFRLQLKEAIGLSALLTFILELQSFSFAIEFIMLPAVTFLSMLAIVGKKKEETRELSIVINSGLALLVIFYFLHSVYLSILSMKDTFSWKNLTELLTPALLSVSFMPFIYSLYLYQTYEQKLISLRSFFDNENTFNYAKNLAILHFRTDLDSLNRWVRDISIHQIKNRKELKESIEKIKAIKQTEANPPLVPYEKGWSPFSAKDFLLSKGFDTDDYHKDHDNWWSHSNMIEIDDGTLPQDNIAYYIYGNKNTATQLKLRININKIPLSKKTQQIMCEATKELLKNSLEYNDFNTDILFTTFPVTIKDGIHNIEITKENYPNKSGGYTIEVKILLSERHAQDTNDKNSRQTDISV